MNNEVAFRRINGRIVPIKIGGVNINKDRKKITQGVGIATAGIATSAISGAAYRTVNRVSSSTAVKAFKRYESISRRAGSGTLFSFARKKKALEMATSALRKAKNIGRFAAPLRLGGQLLGATLVGFGVSKIVDAKTKNKNKSQISAAVGGVATGAFLTGAYKGAGFRSVIKPLYKSAYPHLRLLKSKFHL